MGFQARPLFSRRPEKVVLRPRGRAWKPILLSFIAVCFLAGCRKPDDIVTYTVAKPLRRPAAVDSVETTNDEGFPGQMLGVIIPQEKMTWFFKLEGPVEAVQSKTDSFLKFVESIRLTEKGPTWSLPDAWEEQSGGEMRFATLKVPSDGAPLEVSVIPLPTAPGSLDKYLLSNVNRWRDQLQLPPISAEEFPDKVLKIDLGGTPAWVFNGVGRLKNKGMMGAAPFAGKRPSRPETPAAAHATAALPFDSTLPEGWTPAKANSMQVAAYEVRDGKRKVAISVSSAGGNVAGNVNRWREQVHLEPLEGANLEKALQSITVDGKEGVFVEFVGPENDPERETLLGVIVSVQGAQWFIKLKGDVALAAREKEHFQEFVQSIRFRKN